MRRSFRFIFIINAILTTCLLIRAQEKDPLQGRWEGTVKTQRGDQPVTVTFKKVGATYSGTISGLGAGGDATFKEVKVDGEKVNAKLELPGQRGGSLAMTIRLQLKGETLKGRGEMSMGRGSMEFTYDLKRTNQETGPKVIVAAAKPAMGQAGSQAELDEFNKIQSETEPNAKNLSSEEFLKKYPESGLTYMVQEEMAYAAQRMNNFEAMAEHGEKSMAINPDNFRLLTILGSAYSERNKVDKAEEMGEKAIELVAAAQKPSHLSDAQWTQAKNNMLTINFSTLGYVHLRRALAAQKADDKKALFERSIAPFKKALEYDKADDISLWRLGIAYVSLNDYSNAESCLAKAVAVNGAASTNARTTLEDIYKRQHKDSIEGLDKVIAKAKSELGLP